MEPTLKALLEELVAVCVDEAQEAPLPAADMVELDSEEAWSDFQYSQIAYEKSFKDSQVSNIGPA